MSMSDAAMQTGDQPPAPTAASETTKTDNPDGTTTKTTTTTIVEAPAEPKPEKKTVVEEKKTEPAPDPPMQKIKKAKTVVEEKKSASSLKAPAQGIQKAKTVVIAPKQATPKPAAAKPVEQPIVEEKPVEKTVVKEKAPIDVIAETPVEDVKETLVVNDDIETKTTNSTTTSVSGSDEEEHVVAEHPVEITHEEIPPETTVKVVHNPVLKKSHMVISVPISAKESDTPAPLSRKSTIKSLRKHSVVIVEEPAKPVTKAVPDPDPVPDVYVPQIQHPHLAPLLMKILLKLGYSSTKAMAKMVKWGMYK